MEAIFQFYRNLFKHNSFWLKQAWNWFLLACFVGFITFLVNPQLLEKIASSFQQEFGTNPALDVHLVLQIFLRNIIVSLMAIFGGLILGLGSIIVLCINGFLIGYVLASLFTVPDNFFQTLILILGGLVPHGIFEIPAFLIAGALGLRLGLEWLSPPGGGVILKNNLKQVFETLPAIALVLLLAAFIEVFVSGKIVEHF